MMRPPASAQYTCPVSTDAASRTHDVGFGGSLARCHATLRAAEVDVDDPAIARCDQLIGRDDGVDIRR